MSSNHTEEKRTTADFQSMIQIIFWNSMGFFFFMFILAYITAEFFVVDGKIIGLIIAALPFGRMFVTPIVGWLTDKTSKKRLVLIGSFGRAISYLTYYLSIGFESVYGFAFGVFLQGILVGFFWPPLNALIAEKSSKYYRSEAYGKRGGMTGYGSLVGAIISFSIFNGSDLLIKNFVWLKYSPFLIFTAVNIYAGIQFYRKVDENIKFQEIFKENFQDRKSNNIIGTKDSNLPPKLINKYLFITGLLMLSLASMISSMNDHISRPFIQLFMGETIFQSDTMIMLVMYIAQSFSMIIAPLIGKFADRIRPLWGIVTVSILGATLTGIIINLSDPIIFTTLLIFDFTLGITGTLFAQNIFSRISVQHRGKMFGLVEWMALLGWVIGPIWAGILWDDISFKAPFMLTILLELMLIPLFISGFLLLSAHFAEKIKP